MTVYNPMHIHTADNLRELYSAAGAAGDQATAELAGSALRGDESALATLTELGIFTDECTDQNRGLCVPDGNGWHAQNG